MSATGLSTGVTYYLRVYANTNCNNTSSNYGTSFAFATSSTCITPGTPINLSGSPTGQTTANLSWAAGNPVGSSPVTYYWVVGTSPSVTWANGVAQNSTSETFAFATGLTSGTTYYLRVYATTDCYNSSSNYGTSSAFTTTSGGGVPPNDNCSGATTLLVNSTCNYLTNQTTANATAEFPPSTCSGFSSTFGYDVWYKFVANSTNQTIKVLGGLVFDSVVGLYSSCSSNSLIDCIDATVIEEEETLNVSGLTVGTTYYVRVYNFGGQVGTFAICVVGTGQQNPPGNFNITLTPQCNGATSRVYVQWTQASNATNYDIYRNGTPYYSNTPYDQTGFYDNGVVSGVVYTYKVVAKNTGGNTDNSNGTLQATALNCSCIDNPTLPTYNNGAVVQIKAPNTINATNKINTGANILFQAGKTIYLNPGFIVEQGAIFIAQMGGCNN